MDDESWYVLSQLTNSVQLKKLLESKKEKKNGGKAAASFPCYRHPPPFSPRHCLGEMP